MTRQTKQFIEVADILAFRLECKHCGTSLLVSLKKVGSLPLACANCNSDWFNDPDNLGRAVIGQVMGMLKKLNGLLENQGVKFSIEVTPFTEKTAEGK
jgi:hypothetical protein